MPNPTNELSQPEPIEASPETPTVALNLKLPDESLEAELKKDEQLGFLDQARIVREGFRKGVKYDGCTGVPDFDFGYDCCGEHDAHYQLGDITRWEADKRLRQCIQKKGYTFLAWTYWFGVRVLAGGVWKRYRNKTNEELVRSDDVGPNA